MRSQKQRQGLHQYGDQDQSRRRSINIFVVIKERHIDIGIESHCTWLKEKGVRRTGRRAGYKKMLEGTTRCYLVQYSLSYDIRDKKYNEDGDRGFCNRGVS